MTSQQFLKDFTLGTRYAARPAAIAVVLWVIFFAPVLVCGQELDPALEAQQMPATPPDESELGEEAVEPERKQSCVIEYQTFAIQAWERYDQCLKGIAWMSFASWELTVQFAAEKMACRWEYLSDAWQAARDYALCMGFRK